MPQLMGTFAGMDQKFAEATADLPARRSFAELSPVEQARVAKAIGYSVEDLMAIQSLAESE
jgi:hypothetical protein